MPSRSASKQTEQPRRNIAAKLATRILAAISEKRIAARFIEGYATQFDRKELIVHEEWNRELEMILEREILLAMLARIAHALEEDARVRPRGRTREKPDVGDPNRFVREVVASIGRERGWTAGDTVEILGELILYRDIMAKNSSPVARGISGRPLSSGFRRGANAGPFVDRCAFVLDPSMMENARVSAARVLREIETAANQLLEECVRGWRAAN